MAKPITKAASIESLESLRADPLIELELEIAVDLYIPHAAAPARSDNRVAVSDLVDLATKRPVMVVGPPGAGKTTLLVQLADATRTQPQLSPIFVTLARYKAEDGLGATPTSMGSSLSECLQGLKRKRILLLFDGVNEAPVADLDPLLEQIAAFSKDYKTVRATICTCRTTDFPLWARELFAEVRLRPPTVGQVYGCLRDGLLRKFNESEVTAFLNDRRVREILRICNTPLLLMMLYRSSEQSGLRDFSFLASRAAVYERFCSNLIARDLAKRRPTKFERQVSTGLHEVLLSWIGWQMQNRDLVFAREGALQEWIAAWLQENSVATWVEDSTGVSAASLTRYLLSRPPLRVVDDAMGQDKLVAFLHPSFGEFYAARHHHSLVQKGGIDAAIGILLHDKTRRNWETIRFICGLTGGAATAGTLLSLAAAKFDQELMAIAALTSIDRIDATVTNVEDVVLRVLDAFKNWGHAFQYDIIRVMQTLPNEILSISKSRLFEDIRYFLDKYAHTEAVDLRHTSIPQLSRLLESGSPDEQVNAAYTLSRRAALRHVTATEVASLVQQFNNAVCAAAREHLMVCLKEAPSRGAFTMLVDAIKDPNTPPKVRGYALNALGTSRDERGVNVIIAYLRDHKNPYRDSASWALQVLVRSLFKQRSKELRGVQDTFLDLLVHETSDRAGRYAKGNLVYSIGALQAVHLTENIIQWLPSEEDPYVIEDAVFCLGLLGEPREELAAAIRPFLHNEDPGVRLKAVESIGLLSPSWANVALGEMADEEFPYITWSIKRALEKVGLH